MKYLSYFLIIVLSTFCSVNADDSINVKQYQSKIEMLVQNEALISLSVANCTPDKRITKLMEDVDKIAQTLMTLEPSDENMALSEKCLAIISVLRERRCYAYMLWAEGQLELASSGSFRDVSKLSQSDLVNLYVALSNINSGLITENMLNREIATRLASIYDCLNNDNKQKVRVIAIQQQRDALSISNSIPIRKSLDDF